MRQFCYRLLLIPTLVLSPTLVSFLHPALSIFVLLPRALAPSLTFCGIYFEAVLGIQLGVNNRKTRELSDV